MNDQTCYRASITLAKERARQLSSLLSEVFFPPPDAVGLFEDKGRSWRVEAWFTTPPDKKALRLLADEYAARAGGFVITAVPPADWVTQGQSRLHPVRAGRFLVHGSHDRDRAKRGRWAIEIDAAEAFGTAHHGSTRGCLEALDHLAKRKHFARALDLGTGTGVLAIAVARAWRARVVASDIDPVATQIARANARKNAVGGCVSTLTAPGLAHPLIRKNAPYGLITANILARPLMALAPQIARCVRPGGCVVLSGITANQAARVAAAFRAAGFARYHDMAIGDWVTLTLRRR